MKKTLSVLLTLLLLVASVVPAFAAGEHRGGLVTIDPVDDQASILVPENIDEDIDWDGVFAAIKAAVTAHEDTVSLRQFMIPCSDPSDPNITYIKNYLLYEPVLLRICSQYSYYYFWSNSEKYLDYLILGDYYKFSEEQYVAMVAACDDAAEQLLFGVKGNDALSDAEKCLILHDRLAAWCEYDYDNYLAGTIPNESYCAYGPLALQIGVCQGYAMAYGWMLDILGIENYYTSSSTLNHGWNLVRIDDDVPYYIDVTWDDPVWDITGRVEHSNFLQSFSTFSAGHDAATDFSDEPVSTLYEGSYWESLTSEIQLINGKIYYVDDSAYASASYPDCGNAELKCLDPVTGDVTVLATVNALWTTASNGFYSENYTKLTSIGNKLLYSTPDEIRAYDVVTGEDTLVYAPDFTQYDAGSRIYGLTQRNGDLYVFINIRSWVTQTERGTIETVPYCTDHADKVTLATITPATCSAGGTVKYICADCRAIGTAATEADPSLHSFGDWTTVTAATCTAGGSEKRTCANCDAFETRETDVDASNHVNTENRPAVAATCVAQGRQAGVWCLDCQKFVSGGEAINPDPDAHTFGAWTAVTASTCSVKGTERRDCANCDAFETRETGLDSTNHVNTENRAAVAASCTENGREAGVYCLDCKQYISGGAVVPANPGGHAFGGWTTVTGATCTVKGTQRRDCENCDAYETRETEIDPSNHVNIEEKEAVTATCTVKGRDAGVYCNDCKQYISGGADRGLDAANHVNTENRVAVDATCTVSGREAGVYCNDCKQYVSGGATIGKLPHDYVTVVTEPTCTKGGYTTYSCKNCPDSYTADKTAALGHIDENGDQRCDRCNADLSPEANCSCACHKGGFAGFIFKVKVFFWKLFGMEQYRYCSCGKAHW